MSSHAVYVLSVFLHILAAILWVGGMLFLVAVVVPVLRKPELQDKRAALFHAVGVAFRPVGWICLVVLILTGFLNLHFRGMLEGMHQPGYWESSFGQVLAVKLAVVGILLVLSAVHDFWIGPQASRMAREQPGSSEAAGWRRRASWIGRVNVLLALYAVFLGVMLVRGRPW